MTIDTVKMILEFIQIVAWPLVIYILFHYFSLPIKNLLCSFNDAINKGGVKLTSLGIEIPSLQENTEVISEFVTQPKYFKGAISLNKAEPLDNSLATQSDNATKVLKQHEKSLVQDLLPLINNFLSEKKTPEEQNELLQGLLCDSYISLYFERSYQRILGSQLQLLAKLEGNPGLASNEAKDIFKTRATVEESFEKWLSFLIKSNFVDFEDKKIFLTAVGQEFLQYIKDRNYIMKKMG